MMAHKRETNNPNRLKYSRLDNGETFGGVAFEEGRHEGTFVDDGEDDDEHAAEGEGGGDGEFVDVAVEGEGVGDADCAEGDDELAVGEEGENGHRAEGGEGGADDLGYCVACRTWNHVSVDHTLNRLVHWYAPMMMPKAHMPAEHLSLVKYPSNHDE